MKYAEAKIKSEIKAMRKKPSSKAETKSILPQMLGQIKVMKRIAIMNKADRRYLFYI